MKKLGLLVASQLIALGISPIFPVVVARYYGHGSYGDLALSVSYSGFFLGVFAGAIGQSILEYGMSLKNLTRLVISLLCCASLLWLIALNFGSEKWLVMALSVIYVLFAQSSLHLIYYYAIKMNWSALYTFIFPIEGSVRLLIVIGYHTFPNQLPWLTSYYIASTTIVASAALVSVWAIGARDRPAHTFINWPTSWRYVRWAMSGLVLSNFDRTAYATILIAAPRATYLFYNSLYTTAFSIIANAVSLEVLSGERKQFINSKRGFWILLISGISLACLGTVGVFYFNSVIGEITTFFPLAAGGAVLFTALYRGFLFVQQLCYGYVERGGNTKALSMMRIFASLVLLGLGAMSLPLGRFYLGLSTLIVMAALAGTSLLIVRSVREPSHLVESLNQQG